MGDVGVITVDGAFEFMFNVCQYVGLRCGMTGTCGSKIELSRLELDLKIGFGSASRRFNM